jgi:hypothetical protein
VSGFPTASDLMREIAASRPVFHSEADFQHTVAWHIHRRMPAASVLLERPYRALNKGLRLDLLVKSGDNSLAIELKYKTSKLRFDGPDDAYALKSQSAQDLGRYDYIKDIGRIEEIAASTPRCRGWAILLTNDPGYWQASRRTDTVDAGFRLSEGMKIGGELAWGAKASAGTTRGRTTAIALRAVYTASWSDYSKVSEHRSGMFRYLALEVDGGGRSA